MKNAPENISTLRPNEVFVFGSNLAGRHGKGAALLARRFGAVYGVGAGPAGQTYAIPTKGMRLETLPLPVIEKHVFDFLTHAAANPHTTFLVTAVGCGLACYTPDQIAPMFRAASENVFLPASFTR